MAHSKRCKGTKRIGIAIEMDQPYPHHLGCHEGILRYAAMKEDWHVVVDPYLMGILNGSGVREYDGIVGRISRKAAEQARAAGIPVVNHWINSSACDTPSVLPDCRRGSEMAAEHLLARGFHHFGYVGSIRDRARRFHLSGFEPLIHERGFGIEKFDAPLRCEANSTAFVRFYGRLREWLAGLTKPVALLVSLEVIGLYVVQVCSELGLRIPHDLGIMVCRENPTICLQTTPTLSCIEDDNERIGYRAAQVLDQIMLGETEASSDPIWIEPKGLRVRGSSDAFVSKDPIVSRAMRFMTEHSNQAITVNHVAQAANTSKGTLQQRFARDVGRSVYSEICRLRAERVKRILIDSDATLEQIAIDNGFTDLSHLVKSFRKATGVTPGEFRKRHRH